MKPDDKLGRSDWLAVGCVLIAFLGTVLYFAKTDPEYMLWAIPLIFGGALVAGDLGTVRITTLALPQCIGAFGVLSIFALIALGAIRIFRNHS